MYKELRKRHNLTQKELAEELRIYQSAVSKVELGETKPSYESIKRIYELYGIDEIEMLLQEDSKEVSN